MKTITPDQSQEIVGEAAWEKLTQDIVLSGEKRPTGANWKDLDQLTAYWRIQRTSAINRATSAAKMGILERFEGKIKKGDKLVRCTWYRPKPAKKRP